MRIWIAHYAGGTWNNAYARFCYEVGLGKNGKPPARAELPRKNIQSQSLIAGKLFIHAIGA
jgi:hypothetical protein